MSKLVGRIAVERDFKGNRVAITNYYLITAEHGGGLVTAMWFEPLLTRGIGAGSHDVGGWFDIVIADSGDPSECEVLLQLKGMTTDEELSATRTVTIQSIAAFEKDFRRGTAAEGDADCRLVVPSHILALLLDN